MVEDQPGVLTRISGELGSRGISLASVLQKDSHTDSGLVSLLITTHPAREGNVRAAMTTIDRMDFVEGPSVCIDIIDEPEENFGA